jgi:hypothetical protein
MKLQSYSGSGVETNSENESLEFGIGDPSVIIEILRNRLYSNPIQTLVQEYICNARDAHREAGKESTPIQVELPSKSNLVFSVRDFGCGLSPDQVKNIFVNYGTSTKRKSDKMTGGFGIGAKSAWAYTDNFTVKAVFGGYERHYVAHIGTKNNGVLDKVYENKTDKPNQTTIEIAVRAEDCNAFIAAALRATMFWSVRPELTGRGQEFSDWNYNEGVLSGPNWYYHMKPSKKIFELEYYNVGDLNEQFETGRSYWNTGIVLLVDEIPYRIEKQFEDCFSNLFSVVNTDHVLCVRVGNGDCEVSASREKISDSAESKKRIKTVLDSLSEKIRNELKRIHREVKTFGEFKAFCLENNKWMESRFSSGFSFKGWSVSGQYLKTANGLTGQIKYDEFHNEKQRSRKVKGAGRTILRQSSDLSIDGSGIPFDCVHFYYLDGEFSPLQVKDRIRAVFTEDQESSFILFTENKNLEEFNVKPLSSIIVKTKTRISKPKETNRCSIQVYSPDYSYYRSMKDNFYKLKFSKEDPLRDGKTYVYHVNSGGEYPRYYDVANELKRYSDILFCVVEKKDEEKLKNLPNFVSEQKFFSDFSSYLKGTNLYRDFISEKIASEIRSVVAEGVLEILKKSFSKIDDPEFKHFFTINSKYLLKHSYRNFSWMERLALNSSEEITEARKNTERFLQNILKKYPLLKVISESRSTELTQVENDLIFYINSKNK